jgi:phosphatidylserine/phosphatidylglycerophosphate/cardiolipin synthase-like enzyme
LPDPNKWFLRFEKFGGEGRPWGDGTRMAGRAADGKDPWDEHCQVTPIIGGFAAMTEIRKALEKAIDDARASGKPAGQCGHVYIAGWRFNAQRDLSDNTAPWGAVPRPPVAIDRTAIGLVLRLMQAGVRIRIMVWLPSFIQELVGDLAAHSADHYFLADAVRRESARLGVADPLGVVALDARTAEASSAAAHHQKTIVIRGLVDHVAFCGGVDLGFTRRDAPATPPAVPPTGAAFLAGDWQSGEGIPHWPALWPQDGTTNYTSITGDPTTSPPTKALAVPVQNQASDLPESEGTTPIYGATLQIWHDQHLMLHGPIVRTLEQQFAERWRDSARVYDLSQRWNLTNGQVIFSTAAAIDNDGVVDLPDTVDADAPAGALSPVQMWRTIPWRNARTRPPFQRAEFTVMAGISHAVQQSEHLVWIFDQYFWSMPLARQLNFELTNKTDLHVIVILPPYADTQQDIAHRARKDALDALCNGVRAKVGVFDLWDHRPSPQRGIYCHAKAQTYDGGLLVCGSANLNRRSFLCDSELDCAVADEDVVLSHQQALWSLLFGDLISPAKDWPTDVANLDADGSGEAFFTAFTQAANDPLAYLSPDPWELGNPTLPFQPNVPPVVLPRAKGEWTLNHLADPTSVNPVSIQGHVAETDANGHPIRRPPRLSEVVDRLETTVGVGDEATMPNRGQASAVLEALTEIAPGFAGSAR